MPTIVFFIDPGAGGAAAGCAAGTPVGGVRPGDIPSMVFIIDPGGTDFEAGAGAGAAGARAFPHAGQ
jgi:hypothetical protein